MQKTALSLLTVGMVILLISLDALAIPITIVDGDQDGVVIILVSSPEPFDFGYIDPDTGDFTVIAPGGNIEEGVFQDGDIVEFAIRDTDGTVTTDIFTKFSRPLSAEPNVFQSATFAISDGRLVIRAFVIGFRTNDGVAAGFPVAVARAIPNPAVVGQTITLSGAASFHRDSAKSIVLWEWDLDNDGNFDDASGPVVTTSFPDLGDFSVGLRVRDDGMHEEVDETIVTVRITDPPARLTADAGGPYVFCPQAQPWFLDGTGSIIPDEGVSESGQPGDPFTVYAWELHGVDADFDDAFGSEPDVTAFFSALAPGDYLVLLQVTHTTQTSNPGNGIFALSDTDSAQVRVKDVSDPACSCINDHTARSKSGKVQLSWTDIGADHYNVYRGLRSGGPYRFLASTTSTYATYLDTEVVNGTTYYYVIGSAAPNGDELCQSNEASAMPRAGGHR